MAGKRWTVAALALLGGLVVVVTAVASHGSAANRHQTAHAGCGTPRYDWLCRGRGRITVWNNGNSQGAVLRRKRRPMRPFTRVRAERAAEATIRFRRKASCELGPTSQATEIVTRVDRVSLFRQLSGFTSCRSLNRSFGRVGFFCESTGKCPVVFLSKGRYEASGPKSTGAHTSSVSYLRVVIDACTRVFELRIYNADGTFRRIRRSTREPMEYHLVITQRSETTEAGSGYSWSHSERSTSALGGC